MKFELIWKSIDNEISAEEVILINEMLQDPKDQEYMQHAKSTNKLLVNHFNHKMDISFLAQMKIMITDEFQIHTLKIDTKPIFYFFTIITTIAVLLMIYTSDFSSIVFSSLYKFLPFFNIILALTFGGMILFSMDKVLQKKVFKRN